MKLGLCVPLRRYATPEFIRTLGTVSERLGFDELWVGEHVVMFDAHESDFPLTGEQMPGDPDDNVEIDLFTSLAYLAAVTSSIRLGSYVAILPQRNPVYTAKEAANVDWLSNGRFDFGVGVGWSKEEFAACGAEFARRGARCRSYLEVVKRLWCDEVSEYDDEFYTLIPSRMAPKPVQKPHPPIILAGQSDATLERVASQAQGWDSIGVEPPRIAEQIEKLKAKLAKHGRSRSDIVINACAGEYFSYDHDTFRQYNELGIDQAIILEAATSSSPAELEAMLERLARDHLDFVKSL